MGCIFFGKYYKFEIKVKIVQEYLNGSLSYRALTKKYNITNKSTTERGVNQYLDFVSEGLDKKLQNKEYTRDFKLSVLRFRQENKLSYRETANQYKISNSAILAT